MKIGQHFALLSKVVLRIDFVADSWVVPVRGKESATKPNLKTTLLSVKEVNLRKYIHSELELRRLNVFCKTPQYLKYMSFGNIFFPICKVNHLTISLVHSVHTSPILSYFEAVYFMYLYQIPL